MYKNASVAIKHLISDYTETQYVLLALSKRLYVSPTGFAEIFMKRLILSGLIPAVLLASGLLHSAVVYRWLDNEGVPQYTDQAPKDRQYTVINTRKVTANATTQPEAEKSANDEVEEEATQSAAVDFSEQQRISEENAQIREQNCEYATENLTILEQNARIRIPTDEGDYRYLTEEERQQQLTDARTMIQTNCE